MTKFQMNRRHFLSASAAAAAGIVMRPSLTYAAEGDTLVIRGASDIEVLDPAFQNGLLEEEVGRALFVSLNRLGDDEDLKGLSVLLASDAGKHITGQYVAVDGGVSALVGG